MDNIKEVVAESLRDNSMNNNSTSSDSGSFTDSVKEQIVNALKSEPEPPKTPKSKKKSRRLVQATELRFKRVEKRESVARVAVLLCNISDRPLYYKFKTDAMDSLSALPSATGHLAGRGSSKVVLTWQKPKHTSWKDVLSPKLLLVTRFLDGSKEDKDMSGTRLIAVLDQYGSCPSDEPPMEQLMLDAASKDIGDHEMTITKSDNKVNMKQSMEEENKAQVSSKPVAQEQINQDQSFSTAMILIAAIFAILLYRALFGPNGH